MFLLNLVIQKNWARRLASGGLRSSAAALLLALPVFAQPIVTVAPSLERYAPTDVPPARIQASISAARGEYESFQILVRAPATGLTNVRLAAVDLIGPGGQIIPASSLTLYREHYVYVSQPIPPPWHINIPLGPGWYPDALIPFKDPVSGAPLNGLLKAIPFSVAANKVQGIWVDVLVPRTAAAGQYTGTFTIFSDQGQASVSAVLTVWNFTLPLKPSLKTNFNYWRSAVTLAASISDQTKRTNEELMRHKLMPATVNPPDERAFIDGLGLVNTALPPWSGANASNCTMSPPPSVSTIVAEKALHQPDVFISMNTADEIGACTNLYDMVKAWARNLHEAGVPQLVVMPPTPYLYDDGSGTGRSAVDIWVVLPKQYDAAPNRVAEVIQKGDQVWSYNALMQDQYSPKWQIDYPPINFRIQPGFINQSLGLTGLTYWKIDEWTSDPWNNIENIIVGTYKYRGEGMMVYPGSQVGIVGVAPSMRLKYLRDGVEDYEYIEILKRMGRGSWALQVARTVGPDWTNWTRDANLLESTRLQLGQEIHRLNGGTSSASDIDVWITSPAQGAVVSGVVPVNVSTSANVVRVEFSVDGTYRATDLSAPYSYSLDTTALASGNHTITVVGYDALWKMKVFSTNVTVGTAALPTVTITAPANGATVSGTVNITTNVSSSVSRVEFWVDGIYKATDLTNPFSYGLNTTALVNGAHTITVVAYDAAWNKQISSVKVNVDNAPPVAVTIVSPASGSTISGTVNITTSVSSTVTRIEFSVDGVFKGTDMSAPFTYALNTLTLTKGSHTITVVAYDAKWNMKIASIPVIVSN